jgi:LacI family transcriptional regulator
MKKITIKDVAKEAGVSITIASFALNDVKGRVSREVRTKVLDCADRLGYIPNSFAQNLRTQNTNTIGLIYDEAYLEERNSSTLQFVSSAIKYARERGKDILVKLIDMDRDLDRQILEFSELWDSQRVNGLVFQCGRIEPALLEKMKKKDVNFVIIPAVEKLKAFEVNSVYIDNYKLMKDSIRYIHGKGYEEVYFLTMESEAMTERETGYHDAIKELGLKGGSLYYKSRYRGKGEIWDAISGVV